MLYSFSVAKRAFLLCLFSFITIPAISQGSWEEVNKSKKGSILIYWDANAPFIYETGQNKMAGIEAELMAGFQDFLQTEYEVELEFEWETVHNFDATYQKIKGPQTDGTFAVSAFSITEYRKEEVGFSPPYMSDISVIISSQNIPVVNDVVEFNQVFNQLTAITERVTSYDITLQSLRVEQDLDYDISYIDPAEDILDLIESSDDLFGFIDFPVYLTNFSNNPSMKVNRQNLFAVKHGGYAIVMPQNSTWQEPINAYFANSNFQSNLEIIIGKYLDLELYQFVEEIASESLVPVDPILLLNKEKEIQQRDLLGQASQISQAKKLRNLLITLVVISVLLLVSTILMFRKRLEIQEQIGLQNEQLEKRNQRLQILDQEKTNLINILAHDLRSPLNHVQGLSQVLLQDDSNYTEEQIGFIRKIKGAASRMSQMITKILDIDAIENKERNVALEILDEAVVIQNVIASYSDEAKRKNINVIFKKKKAEFMVKADPIFLTQIYENLISNALKFSNPGSKVRISLKAAGSSCLTEIEDEGPGLSEEDQGQLFNKYQKLGPRPTAGESSTGLGLHIVKKYVELMNGKVSCASELDKGSTFKVELPVLAKAMAD